MDLPLDQQIRRKAESMQQFAGEEADALNALYKPEKPYVTGVVYYAEPIDGVEHKPALSRFWEAAKSPD